MSTVEKAMHQLRGGRRSSLRDDRHSASKSERRQAAIKLDMPALARAGLAPPPKLARQFRREYQRIKRPILNALDSGGAMAPNSNRLMVTSPNAKEGKTFTSFNLALNIASELDHSVLLIDGDVVQPAITRTLHLGQHAGLMDTLLDSDLDPENAVLSTDVPGLSIMPAGQTTPDAVERLSSQRMAEVMDQLSLDPARLVLIDTPPVLALVEGQAIANQVGRVLMVVAAESTEQRALQAALSLLDTHNAEVSLVLNKNRAGPGADYSGYYGVYYGENGDAGT